MPVLGNVRFHSYAAMIALGFLIPTLLCAYHGSKVKPPIYVPTQAAVWALIGGFIGAKAFWILQFNEWTNLWHAFLIWEPGLVFYGGLIGGFAGVFIYLLVTKTFDWRIADAAAPYIALGQAFGRMGCFLNGCCWGHVADYPWTLSFPRGSYAYRRHIDEGLIDGSAAASLHVHPTQLYEVMGLLIICGVLAYRLSKAYSFTFAIFLEYMFLYGLLRFLNEFFRGDSARPVFNFLTVSQAVSLCMIVVGAVAYVILERHHRNQSQTATPDSADEAPETAPAPEESSA
jgi:phosphatidylglycerol:prolipoprotein diacylglycerol transferase